MDLLRVVVPLAIAWTLVARGKAGDVPVVVSCFLVSSALFRFSVRGRRNNPRPSGLTEDVEVNDSLIELHKPPGTPSVQVLFFHGLPFEKSSRMHLTTWECGDGSSNLWPQTWLVEEFPGAHVFVVRYSQGLSEDSRKTVDMKIVVENLLSDLIQGKIGQVQGCPVVLVGHSVGGLVIKRLCLEAHETLSLSRESSNDRVQQLQNFLIRIGGIFYYGTPHRGIPHILKAADLLDSPLFKYFHTLSTDAARLNDKFSRLRNQNSKWEIKGLAENRAVKSGVFRGIVVVPEASAREEQLNVETADHFSISKPPSKTSRRFNAVAGLLQNVLNQPKEDACPRNLQYVPKHVQGIDSVLQEVKERLKTETSLCLIGMGGLGKSTLAKVLFNELAPKFEYTCFVSDVKLIQGNEEALKKEVWKRMFHNGKEVGTESDWSKVRGKELLLVFDDISKVRDQNVLSEMADGPSSESRFIATSRDHRLLDNTYEVPPLNADYAQKLFVSHAFPTQVTPLNNLVSLVEQIVNNCGRLPLALEVIGKYLRGREQEEDWKQALVSLGKADAVGGINENLWEKLRLSYNGLEDNEKQMFLDATTFFSRDYNSRRSSWTLREAKMLWREAYQVSENLLWRTLVERSLVYHVEEDEVIEVHEQLRSLGQKIASESNHERRVWERPKVLELLQSTNESEKQNIHSLRLGKLSWDDVEEIRVAHPNLPQLRNLRCLQVEVPLVIEANLEEKWFPRNLVLLACVGFQLFDPARQSRLVILELTDIDAEHLPNSIGQLSRLRSFSLRGAPRLHSLPDGIGQLSQLESLSLDLCESLETLPETFGKLSNLKELRLFTCSGLRTLPESFGNLSALDSLQLDECGNLQTLPDSFGRLSKLTRLDIFLCPKFHSLPESFGDLSALVTLVVWSCDKLESLPDSFGRLRALTHLNFHNCAFQSLPGSFGKLIRLSHLTLDRCTNLHTLPDSSGQLGKLEYLKMSGASELESLPTSLAALNALRHLVIDSTSINSIPDYIRTLPLLQTLELRQLAEVKELPPWLGEAGRNSLAFSRKVFQVRGQHFSLIGDNVVRERHALEYVHARFMWKVRKSDYAGALAFFLQERGILKRMAGDLGGALEDLTTALEMYENNARSTAVLSNTYRAMWRERESTPIEL